MSALSRVGFWSRVSPHVPVMAAAGVLSGLLVLVAMTSGGKTHSGATVTSPRVQENLCYGKIGRWDSSYGIMVYAGQRVWHRCDDAGKGGKVLAVPAKTLNGPAPLITHGGGAVSASAGPLRGVFRGPARISPPPPVVQQRDVGSRIANFLVALVLGALVGLVLLASGVVQLVRRRRSHAAVQSAHEESPAAAEEALATAEAALAAAAADALPSLRIEGSARRAIIGCYAQMERCLAREGLPRRPAEAPLEYCRRVLASVAPEAGLALTELFERAMFSQDPLGEREKERAIEALHALQGGAAVRLPA